MNSSGVYHWLPTIGGVVCLAAAIFLGRSQLALWRAFSPAFAVGGLCAVLVPLLVVTSGAGIRRVHQALEAAHGALVVLLLAVFIPVLWYQAARSAAITRSARLRRAAIGLDVSLTLILTAIALEELGLLPGSAMIWAAACYGSVAAAAVNLARITWRRRCTSA